MNGAKQSSGIASACKSAPPPGRLPPLNWSPTGYKTAKTPRPARIFDAHQPSQRRLTCILREHTSTSVELPPSPPSQDSMPSDDSHRRHVNAHSKRIRSDGTDDGDEDSAPARKFRSEAGLPVTSGPSPTFQRASRQPLEPDTSLGLWSKLEPVEASDSDSRHVPKDQVPRALDYVKKLLGPKGTTENGNIGWSSLTLPESMRPGPLPASQGSESTDPGSHHGSGRQADQPAAPSQQPIAASQSPNVQQQEADFYSGRDQVVQWAKAVRRAGLEFAPFSQRTLEPDSETSSGQGSTATTSAASSGS